MSYPFYIVDVFAEEKYAGNQLAVFRQGKDISDADMQRLAKEMNYSETTFVLSEEERAGGYDVRIFTPARERAFAGHPTLGTAFIIQQKIVQKPISRVNLNLKIGQVPVTFTYREGEADILWMKQLNPVFGKTHSPKPIAEFLGLNVEDIDTDWPVQEVSTGVPFFMIPLKSKAAVVRTKLDKEKLIEYTKNTEAKWPLVFCRQPESQDNHLKVRMITTFTEDPATGSANGCLAGYLAKYRYFGDSRVDVRVEQGAEIGRPSLLYLKSEDHGQRIDVYVGGKNAMVAQGQLI